jgi:hypothetical protein
MAQFVLKSEWIALRSLFHQTAAQSGSAVSRASVATALHISEMGRSGEMASEGPPPTTFHEPSPPRTEGRQQGPVFEPIRPVTLTTRSSPAV